MSAARATLNQDNDTDISDSVYFSPRGGSDSEDNEAEDVLDPTNDDDNAMDSNSDGNKDEKLKITIRPKNTSGILPPSAKKKSSKTKATTAVKSYPLRKSPRSAGAEKRKLAHASEKKRIPDVTGKRRKKSQSESTSFQEEKEVPFSVGDMCFVRDEEEGVEYLVRVMPRTLESDDNGARDDEEQRQIQFIGYKAKELIGVSKLLPWTHEREKTYNNEVVKRHEQEEGAEEPTLVENPKIGSRYFYKAPRDGVEYPVKLLKLQSSASSQSKKANSTGAICSVQFEKPYKSRQSVLLSELLPATPRREEKFEIRLDNTKQERIAKKLARSRDTNAQSRASPSKASRPARTSTTKHPPNKNKATASKACTSPRTTISAPKKRKLVPVSDQPASESAEVDDDVQNADSADIIYGPATDTSNLPTALDAAKVKVGTMWTQGKRHIYFAKDNETPALIASKARLPIQKLLYDNSSEDRKLQSWNKLNPKTPIVLPLFWRGEKVATGIKSVNSAFRVNSGKKSSSSSRNNNSLPKSKNNRARVTQEDKNSSNKNKPRSSAKAPPSPKKAPMTPPKRAAPKKPPAKKKANDRDDRYEPATSLSNLPTEEDRRKGKLQDPGTIKMEVNRILYFACQDERVQALADKFAIPVEKVLYDNRKRKGWGRTRACSQILKRTPIVIPLVWNGSYVRLQQPELPIPPTQAAPANHEIAYPCLPSTDLYPPTDGVPAAAAAASLGNAQSNEEEDDSLLYESWMQNYNLHTSL